MNLQNISTEKINEETILIDQMSIKQILEIINKEDEKIAKKIYHEIDDITKVIEVIYQKNKIGGRLVYVGAGTSGRMGVLDASEMYPTFNSKDDILALIAGGDFALRNPVEFAEDDETQAETDLKSINLTKNDVVIGIGASGRTPYSIGAIQYANKIKAVSVGLSMSKNSEFKKIAQYIIEIDCGPEVITGSTRLKAGTATKLVLNMISTTLMIKKQKTLGNLMIDVRINNKKLYARAINIIKQITNISDENLIKKTLKEADDNVRIAVIMIFKKCSKNEALAWNKENGNLHELLKY